MLDTYKELSELLKVTPSPFRYIDENWGQLDIDKPPVMWPCALIGIDEVEFESLGFNGKATPKATQQASLTISVTVADLRLRRGNPNAPTGLGAGLSILELADEVRKRVHGKKFYCNNMQLNNSRGVASYVITFTRAAMQV